MVYESASLFDNNGKWRGQLRYRDDSGKWRKRSKIFNVKGKREAQRELEAWRAEMEAEAERQAGTAPGLTVSEYVAGYIDTRANKIEASSLTGYRGLLRNQIAPYIGDVELSALTVDAVEKWFAALCRDRSRYTANKSLVLLRSALSRAHERGIIPSDPTATVEKAKERKQRPNSLAARERGMVAAYIDIDPTDPVSIAVRLALYTGMRRAEICALRWRSVDIQAGTLRVVESLGAASGRAIEDAEGAGAAKPYADLYLKEPKTTGSRRTITYPEAVGRALKARRAAMAAECLAAGIPFDESMFVCGTIDGKPLHPRKLWRRWSAIVSALGIVGTEGNPPTFHDLRHTYATTAIANGVDVKTVSNQMGHANAAMTLNTYASADPDAARRAAEAMERALSADARAAAQPAEIIEMKGTGTDGR